MSVCLLLIGDGRDDYRERTLESARDVGLFDQVTDVVEIDDRGHRLGFAGAVQAGWDAVIATGAEWVFHLELDFTFHARVDVHAMVGVLQRHWWLGQVVLKRQAWNDQEKAAGGIVEVHPDDFIERTDGQRVWTEHRRFWSTNPSVYSTNWCRIGWPQVPQSEGVWTHKLLADPAVRFAFWGGKFDAPLVHHIGEARAGKGY